MRYQSDSRALSEWSYVYSYDTLEDIITCVVTVGHDNDTICPFAIIS